MVTRLTEHMQQTYLGDLRRLCRHRLFYLLLMTAALFIFYVPLDFLLVPGHYGELFYYRLTVLLFCLFLFFLNYQDTNLRYTYVLSFTLYGFCLFVLCLMVSRTGGMVSEYFIGFILAIVVFAVMLPLTPFLTLVSGSFAVVSYLLAVFWPDFYFSGHVNRLINNVFFMACFAVLVAIQSWFETKSRKESFSLHMQEQEAAQYLEEQAEALESEVARRSKEHQQTENRFRRLFDHIVDDVILVDKNGWILYANASFYDHLGLVQGNKINIIDRIVPHEQEQFRQSFLQAVASGEIVGNYQARLMGIDGVLLEVEINGNKMERGRRLIGLQLIIRDISVRKRMEEDVRKGLFVRKQTENAMIMALARLSEYRDVTPENHLKRIREYSRLLAEFLARKPEYQGKLGGSGVSDLAMASILHDIGKVGIADDILFQSGPLSPQDEAMIRQHTIFGGDVIKAMEQSSEVDSGFLEYAKNIAYFHHEKWDGSGYPFGLVGKEIPLEARIVGLADAYESMTSSGKYGKQLSHKQAVHVLIREAGQHFDPDIVDAFVDCEQDFLQIFSRLTPLASVPPQSEGERANCTAASA